MVITKIELQKRNKEKANIHIDGKYAFSITVNGLLECGLKEGSEISTDDIEKIRGEDEPSLAVMEALNIISYSMKTERELRQKLRDKKYSDAAIEHAIQKAKKYGFIDDASYVASYIQSKAMPNGWGEQKIISMLLKKGVDMQLIKDKIAECYSEEDREDNAMNVARKYYTKLKGEDSRKNKQKLYGHLISKGFKYDIASSVCRKLFDNDDDY